MTETLKYQIALSLLKGVGPKIARNLVAYVGDVDGVFKQSERALAKIPGIGPAGARQIKKSDVMERAEQEVEFVMKHQITPLFFTAEEFPFRLSYCDDAPLMIYLKGTNHLNKRKIIGVVGTREATEEGKINCDRLLSELSVKYPELLVVSGLAYGIDICAHQSALRNQLGTYGVLAHGLDRLYPAIHRQTAMQMLEKGGLITEFVSQTNPDRPFFVRRNRIVAGLVDALVLVESGLRGGALITARIAHSYNRDVLAFPGDVSNEKAKGCNYLIKSNVAALIENAEDLERAIGWESVLKGKAVQKQLFTDFSSEEERVLYELMCKNKEMTANELSLVSQLPVSKVSAGMLALEFMGLVKCLPGNAFKLL